MTRRTLALIALALTLLLAACAGSGAPESSASEDADSAFVAGVGRRPLRSAHPQMRRVEPVRI